MSCREYADGIFLVKAPDFDPGGSLGEISITDIAPSVLAMFDLPRPSDMDAEAVSAVREGLGEGECEPLVLDETTGVAYDEVADRLKQLGYME